MHITEIFSGVAESIAQLNPKQLINLKAPASMSVRVEELVNKKKDNAITTEESNELERFLALDLFISMTKARARIILNS